MKREKTMKTGKDLLIRGGLMGFFLFSLLTAGCKKQEMPLMEDLNTGEELIGGPGLISGGDLTTGVGENSGAAEGAGLDEKYGANAKILSEEDCFVETYHCGYSSADLYLMMARTIQSDEEMTELKRNMENGSTIAPFFEEFQTQYSFEEYDYVIQYDQYNNMGYKVHANALITSDQGVFFNYDEYEIPFGQTTAQAMDGYVHMAAVKKGILSK